MVYFIMNRHGQKLEFWKFEVKSSSRGKSDSSCDFDFLHILDKELLFLKFEARGIKIMKSLVFKESYSMRSLYFLL